MKEENTQRKINAMEVMYIKKFCVHFTLIFILISYYLYRHYAYFFKEYFPRGLIILVLKLLIF